MKQKIVDIIRESAKTKEALLSPQTLSNIESASAAIISTINAGGKIIVFGNGGSAADSQHLAAELVGRFQKERRPVPAIALTTNTSNLTAIANDYGYEASFSRQLEALGKRGDVAIGISTSGSSRNVIAALIKAKEMGLGTISLTGCGGGKAAEVSDISVVVSSGVTARIQESHILLCHIICRLVEEQL